MAVPGAMPLSAMPQVGPNKHSPSMVGSSSLTAQALGAR
jgi:hypothetical protein